MDSGEYRYDSIKINSREVLIADIVTELAEAKSPFEQDTFTFIKDWFHAVEEFGLQTSGSTGAPKKMQVARWQMEASARATIDALGLRPGMVALICLDTRYVAGKMMLVRCFVGDMRIVAVEPSANPLAALDDQAIDFAALVPYQLHQTLTNARERLDQIGKVIVGGAPVSGEILRSLDSLRSCIILTYGMTETLSHIALQRLNGPSKNDRFNTLPGVRITKDGRGCLEIETPWLPEPVLTNDLIEMTSDASFRWLGRIDTVINTGGVKVSPELVEKHLESLKSQLNLHGRLVISSLPDPLLGEKVICVVEEQGNAIGRKNSLLTAFSVGLSRYERPRDILFIFPFPETPSGKVDRLKIKALASKIHNH
jgi:o-succinylbenzoate---CoA ligase